MRLSRFRNRPYVVINGKDFAAVRWFDLGRTGPLFIQVAGRTPLHREDLPTDDWLVTQSGSGTTRISTAWRRPWFDYRPDTSRKLAFLGASTEGSAFLLLRYLARRFGTDRDESVLASRAVALASTDWWSPFVERIPDTGLSQVELFFLDSPSSLSSYTVAEIIGGDPA